ncbi:hypothetical protein I4U23_023575 [Adineta vaga]|nr:hypothetical protein I4U23_023575 [Adineta vaga]
MHEKGINVFNKKELNNVHMNFLNDEIEETLGIDLNKNGRIGGAGPISEIERVTHIDLNRDGIIGGYRSPPSGGNVYLRIYKHQ